jgi:hypothetical protein
MHRATQTILHDAAHPSYLELPVVDRWSVPARRCSLRRQVVSEAHDARPGRHRRYGGRFAESPSAKDDKCVHSGSIGQPIVRHKRKPDSAVAHCRNTLQSV